MKYLPQDVKIFLEKNGVTETKGPGYADRRKFWVTLVDPFDLAAIFRGTEKERDKFWENCGGSDGTSGTGVKEVQTV